MTTTKTTDQGIATVTREEWNGLRASVDVYSSEFCADGFVAYGYVASSTACGGKKHVGYLVLVDWTAPRLQPAEITAMRALDSMEARS